MYFGCGSVQRGTKTNHTTHFTIDVHGNWHLHVYWWVVCQVCVASRQNFYNVTKISKTNCTSSFNTHGYVLQILQGTETYFWSSPRLSTMPIFRYLRISFSSLIFHMTECCYRAEVNRETTVHKYYILISSDLRELLCY